MGQTPRDFDSPFKTIGEAASDAIITIDATSTILYVNASAERIFGYSASEMLGQPLTMLMPEYLRQLHREGLHRYLSTGQRHIAWEGTELPGLRKDGRSIVLEISFGEFTHNGGRFFSGIVRDITQKKYEQRLRAAYGAAIEVLARNLPFDDVLPEVLSAICKALAWKLGIVWNLDQDAGVLKFGSGWSASDDHRAFLDHNRNLTFNQGAGLPGRVWSTKEPAWLLKVGDDPAFTRSDLAAGYGLRSAAAFPVLLGAEVCAVMEFFTTELEPPDQTLLDTFRTIELQLGQYIARRNSEEALLKNEAELRRLVVSEKETRQRAEEANRVKDEFLTMLSHELRTPLTAVFGWVQLLLNRSMDPQITTKALNAIDRNVRTQVQLIDELINTSELITGKLNLRREVVDAIQIVHSAIETVRPSADAKEIQLRLEEVDTQPLLLSADPVRLKQMVWNLLTNAVKFTGKHGSVWVQVKRVGSDVHIVVKDTGEGVDADFLPHVFERFTQADSSPTRHHGGLGLGLALVRHLTELHGGQVRAESPGKGKGSTFTISLPLVGVAPATAVPDTTGQAEITPTLEGLRVLVVEDEADTRDMIVAALQQSGASVAEASSAAEALKEIIATAPDILISDIGMPDVDGYELLAMIRRRYTTQTPPAIALTAYATKADMERARLAGYQVHIPKPVVLSDLVSVVAGLAKKAG